MKLRKKLFTFCCTFCAALFSLAGAARADAYSDISSSHWAYQAVENLYAKGYLKDFRSEKFNPDSYIDKFTISKILAAAAGYTEGDYSAQKNIISKFSSKFSKWNTESEEQIAFLISKNIITEEDLESFMLFSDDGSEKFRAISREETAVFLVRLLGKQSEAEKMSSYEYFSDISSVTESRRGSINYLKSINVLSGDSNGMCSPKRAVTRAEFCVLLNNTVNFISSSVKTEDNSDADDLYSVSGTVANYYKNLNLIQINSDGEINTYRLSESVKITFDEEESDDSAITENIKAEAVINNSEITQLSLSESEEKQVQTEKEKDVSDTEQLCMDSSASGTIQSIKIISSLENECIIGIQNDDGKTLYFSGTRYTLPMYYLKTGAIVSLTAENGKIRTIKVTDKNENVYEGSITDIDDDKITIETADGEERYFYYSENSTECYDCTSGGKIDFDDINKFTEVYIFCEDTNSRIIDVIFVTGNL